MNSACNSKQPHLEVGLCLLQLLLQLAPERLLGCMQLCILLCHRSRHGKLCTGKQGR